MRALEALGSWHINFGQKRGGRSMRFVVIMKLGLYPSQYGKRIRRYDRSVLAGGARWNHNAKAAVLGRAAQGSGVFLLYGNWFLARFHDLWDLTSVP